MLTIDKAIEIVTIGLPADNWRLEGDLREAIKLLIEASKRFKALREVIRVPYTELLPGEEPE